MGPVLPFAPPAPFPQTDAPPPPARPLAPLKRPEPAPSRRRFCCRRQHSSDRKFLPSIILHRPLAVAAAAAADDRPHVPFGTFFVDDDDEAPFSDRRRRRRGESSIRPRPPARSLGLAPRECRRAHRESLRPDRWGPTGRRGRGARPGRSGSSCRARSTNEAAVAFDDDDDDGQRCDLLFLVGRSRPPRRRHHHQQQQPVVDPREGSVRALARPLASPTRPRPIRARRWSASPPPPRAAAAAAADDGRPGRGRRAGWQARPNSGVKRASERKEGIGSDAVERDGWSMACSTNSCDSGKERRASGEECKVPRSSGVTRKRSTSRDSGREHHPIDRLFFSNRPAVPTQRVKGGWDRAERMHPHHHDVPWPGEGKPDPFFYRPAGLPLRTVWQMISASTSSPRA